MFYKKSIKRIGEGEFLDVSESNTILEIIILVKISRPNTLRTEVILLSLALRVCVISVTTDWLVSG